MLVFSIPKFFFTTWVMVVSLQMHGYRSCIEKERIGLLELKAYVNSSFSYDWPSDTNSDCCRWERVKCDLTSGRVIGLFLNYTWSSRPLLNLSLFYPFGELKTLDLNTFGCTGWFDEIHGYKSLGRLKKLEILDFGDSNNEVNSSVLPFLSSASSLKTLILHGNSLEGTFPMNELKDLRNLQLLDLSGNMFIGPLPSEDLSYFHKLRALDLSDNGFSGSLENQGLCQLENLQELDLSQNKLAGLFPQCFGNLTKLQVLDISSNQFNGTLPHFTSRLNSLEYLSLSDNEFEGPFSFDLIANLSNLKVLKLSSRSSLLHIKTEISWQPKFQLSVMDLQYCNLKFVPSFLQHQQDLRLINLSNNKLTGAIPSWFLEKNTKLGGFLLQNNSFTMFQLPRLLNHSLKFLDVSTNEFGARLPKNIGKVLPNLRHLNLSNNRFQGNLPSSLGDMKKIFFLDLSRNNLSGTLPRNFRIGCDSLQILKLSYNRFNGQIFSQPTNLVSLSVFNADNNLFTGIADGLLQSQSLGVLDLSNNYLQGVIPSWFGGFTTFMFLFISNNLLQGTVPSSLFHIPTFIILDLSRNNFSGNLPSHFGGAAVNMLILNDNEFSGTIPSTLIRGFFVLDLRNNKLSGTLPRFTSDQFVLSLLLRGNRLTGHIPKDLCSVRSIKMLDLANNRFNGSIPSCLNNVSFGRRLDYNNDFSLPSYGYATELSEAYSRSLILPVEFSPNYSGSLKFVVEFASKSRYDSYTERSLDFMFGLDLSNNELSGNIPKELGDLQRMRALNLSHNSLSGLIPESFSNLTDIESIDLSFNMLHGPIPQDLTHLDYMVVFNVSYNNLSGSIPSQGKFSTLDETNYIGNPLLCGSSIHTSCDSNNIPEPDYQSGGDDESAMDMETFYWSLAATYGITWMAFLVFLCFDSPWRGAWFRRVDAFINLFKCV